MRNGYSRTDRIFVFATLAVCAAVTVWNYHGTPHAPFLSNGTAALVTRTGDAVAPPSKDLTGIAKVVIVSAYLALGILAGWFMRKRS